MPSTHDEAHRRRQGSDAAGVRWHQVLKRFSKRFDRETSISDNTAHRERVDGIMAWNREKPHTVRHDDMLALTHDPEPAFSKALTACR